MLAVISFRRTVRSQLTASGTARVEEIVHRRVNLTCQDVIRQSAIRYINETIKDNAVTHVGVDAIAIGELASLCNTRCQYDLEQYQKIDLRIPRGALTGSSYLADKGRDETFTLYVSYDISTEYTTVCHSVGINQIRYAVYLIVNATAHVTVPAHIADCNYTYYIPVCEMMYSADVPNVYVADDNGTNYLDLLP
jgi:hypothetical protein